MNPLNWISEELEKLESQHLRRIPTVRHGPQTLEINLDGRSCINFGANDYLGLANDVGICRTVMEAIAEYGWGSGASASLTGRSSQHDKLEKALAKFEGTDAALVFPTGYAANVGTLTSLAGRGDVIFSDEKNHASLIDGCRLSRADIQIYPHVDMDFLRNQLRDTSQYRRKLIVTDGLFSMDGDVAPLPDLVALAEQYEAILIVDEAHATGVLGSLGRGACEAMGVEDRVAVRTGNFSKAFGSIGGFVTGSEPLIRWLYNRARSQVFSTALPAAACTATLAALQNVEHEPYRRRELLERAQWLRTKISAQGWELPAGNDHIIPVIVGQATDALALSQSLLSRGIYVPAIRPPTVAPGESRLRISLSYLHREEHCEALVDQLGRCKAASTSSQ